MFEVELISKLRKVRKVAVLTGAGVSAESGVPTFRGEEGLWKKFRAEELANFDAFMRNPDLVWEWYSFRKKMMAEVTPNPGHYALVKMEEFFSDFSLITQNIDDLHRQAGSKNIIELHGNIHRNYCLGCGKFFTDAELVLEGSAPKCACGGLIRPDVVWFGEQLPARAIDTAFLVAGSSEVFFSIGTSAVVYPAAWLPLTAKQNGALLIEINIERTALTGSADYFFSGPSGKILPQLVEELKI